MAVISVHVVHFHDQWVTNCMYAGRDTHWGPSRSRERRALVQRRHGRTVVLFRGLVGFADEKRPGKKKLTRFESVTEKTASFPPTVLATAEKGRLCLLRARIQRIRSQRARLLGPGSAGRPRAGKSPATRRKTSSEPWLSSLPDAGSSQLQAHPPSEHSPSESCWQIYSYRHHTN